MIERIGVVCQGGSDSILTLSGGNQQKVMIGRWLIEPCGVLLLDEPFQGVDIGARRDIGRQIRASAQGRATHVFVSEIDEALEIADRIVVLHEGAVAGEHINQNHRPGALLVCTGRRDPRGKRPPGRRDKKGNQRLLNFAIKYGFLILLAGLILYFSLAAQGFASPRSAVFILQSVAITGILALGVTCTLVVDGFDLSIGAVATSALMLSAYAMVVLEQSAGVAIVLCLLMGASWGW